MMKAQTNEAIIKPGKILRMRFSKNLIASGFNSQLFDMRYLLKMKKLNCYFAERKVPMKNYGEQFAASVPVNQFGCMGQ